MKNILLILLIICFTKTYSQLQITQDLTPTEYVSHLVGSGVQVSNATYIGDPRAIGKFKMSGSSKLELNSGVILTTGRAIFAIGPNNQRNVGSFNSGGSDPQLALLASLDSSNIYDAAVLEFDFIPFLDTIKLTYVFASEEYPEFLQSNYYDVIGMFITGNNPTGTDYLNHNIALIPGTNTSVNINTINNGETNQGPCMNCSYYLDNGGSVTIQYDGLTTAITASAVVTPNTSYHFKIAIADVYDVFFDSGIFLKAGSFKSSLSNTITKVVKCSGDTCFWHNNSYTVEGSYYDTLQSYKGYDSICQLYLVVNPSYLIKENIKDWNNEGYFWHGENINISGLYYDSLQTINGCDSIYKLNLNYIKNTIDTICKGDSIEWRGDWYSETGVFEENVISHNSCDSVYVLKLKIVPIPKIVSIIQNPNSGIVTATDLCGIYLATSFIGTDYWIQKGSVIQTNRIAGNGLSIILGNNFQLGNYEIWSEIDNGCITQQGTASFYINTTIDIRNIDSQIEIDLYPNPTNGIFSINIKDAKDSDMNLVIYSALGQIVLSEKLNITTAFTKQFDLSNEAKGIYYIKLINDKGICYSNKIIIQ